MHCNLQFINPTKGEGGTHSRWCEKNPKNIARKNSILEKICVKCSKCFDSTSRPKAITCSKKCAHTRSPEDKEKISIGRKKFLKDNPDKHPWKNSSKFISGPCEIFKKHLTDNGYQFNEEWAPLTDRAFSIDIAFVDKKIGIEINGNQHYNRDGNLKPYYQERHDLIVSAGWTLIEVHYSYCFNVAIMNKILTSGECPDAIIKTPKNKHNPERAGVKHKRAYEKSWEHKKNLIFDLNIDYNKFGWVTKLANFLEIQPQKVNLWMIRFHPEFHKTCFHKKKACFI
jgi:hypothetical protein